MGYATSPQSPVRIPVENLHGWVDVTQRLGRGIVSSILGTQQLLQDEEKVTAEGELAAFFFALPAFQMLIEPFMVDDKSVKNNS